MMLDKPVGDPDTVIFLYVTYIMGGTGHDGVVDVDYRDALAFRYFIGGLQVGVRLRRNQQAIKALGNQCFRDRELA
ncbi:hypothetical protein D3C77_741700 [compost metagenome]